MMEFYKEMLKKIVLIFRFCSFLCAKFRKDGGSFRKDGVR